MAKNLKIGQRVRFEDDERLDIPDTQALQELVYDYINEMTGAFLGGNQASLASVPVGGSMAKLTIDATTATAAVIAGPSGGTSAAMFMHTYEVSAGVMETEALVYDPTATGQQTTVNLSTYVTPGDQPKLWARRVTLDLDVDTRRKWNIGGGAEDLFSLATREGYRIEFQVTATFSPPSTDARWFCVAELTVVTATPTFTVATVHPFDCGVLPSAATGQSFSDRLVSKEFIGAALALDILNGDIAQESASRIAADTLLQDGIDTNTGNINYNIGVLSDLLATTSEHTDAIAEIDTLRPVAWAIIRPDGSGAWTLDATSHAGSGGVSLGTTTAWSAQLTVLPVWKSVHCTVSANNSGALSASGGYTAVVEDQLSPTTKTSGGCKVWLNTFVNLAGAAWDFSSAPASPVNPTVDWAVTLTFYNDD